MSIGVDQVEEEDLADAGFIVIRAGPSSCELYQWKGDALIERTASVASEP